MRDGRRILVVLPVAMATDAIAGSVLVNCGTCWGQCLASPASIRHFAEGRYDVIECMTCARASIARDPDDAELLPPTREQLDELRQHRRAHGR